MIEQLKKDLDGIKKNIGVLDSVVNKGIDERAFDMSYEIEKMKYESSFNAKNILFILVICAFIISQFVLAFGIYQYFSFEKHNTQKYMEIVNSSDDNSVLFNSVNNKGE